MPSKSYALEENGGKRLEISWAERSFNGRWKDVTLRLDGETVGTVPGWTDLSAGHEFPLPDGSTVEVRVEWTRALTEHGLRVLRDGQPLPGSPTDPATTLRWTYQTLFLVAGLNIVLGLLRLEPSGGWGVLAVGALFLGLAFFVWRRSLVALLIAIAVLALDSVAAFFLPTVLKGWRPDVIWWQNPVAIIIRIAILWQLIQGVGAIRAMRKRNTLPQLS